MLSETKHLVLSLTCQQEILRRWLRMTVRVSSPEVQNEAVYAWQKASAGRPL